MQVNRQPPLLTPAEISAIVTRRSGDGGLLLGLDFDGTLAPIDPDPAAPIITPAVRRSLATLATEPNVIVAVISGRSLTDLRPRIGVDGIVYWGNHGLERWWGGRRAVHPHAARHRTNISRVTDRVADGLSGIPKVTIEDKGLTATVHTRQQPPEQLDEIRNVVEEAVRSVGPGLTLEDGKHIFEIRPGVDWDKGSVMNSTSAVVGNGWSVMYIGDDTTDEDAFRAIRPDGVGVLVGTRPTTDARCRVASQDAVAPLLESLAEDWAGR